MTEFVVAPCVLLNGNLTDFRLGVHKITPNKFTKGGNCMKKEKSEEIKKLDGIEDIYEKLGYALGRHLIPNGCWHCMVERCRLDANTSFCHKSLEVEEKDLISFKPFYYLHCYQNEWMEHFWPAECKEFIEAMAVEINARE